MGLRNAARLLLGLAVAVALIPACGGGGGGGGGGSGWTPTGGPPGTTPWGFTSYDPTWANIAPAQVIPFTYNSGQTSQQNGAALAAAILALVPGDRLEVGPGTYSINQYFNIVLQGTPSAPIWIVAADLANKPVFTRPDANENAVNIGSGTRSEYLCLRGIEITGGDSLLRLYDCFNVWIDQCVIHDGQANGITANSVNTSYLFITRNEIYNTGPAPASAEGMYLGGNSGSVIMSYSVIALNHVYNTGGNQGEGIELKQGSFNNWIANNEVHDCNYPCIVVMGTGGAGINLVERNTLYRSNDAALQVQGEAVVRNNLIMNVGRGFQSNDQQGSTRDLSLVHNTIVSTDIAANLSSWNNRANMVFANNAVYSRDQESIRFPNGSTNVAVAGNVVLGPVLQVSSGFVFGTGLGDFTNVSWDTNNRNALPSAGGPLIGAGDGAYGVGDDINGATRVAPLDTGAFDAP